MISRRKQNNSESTCTMNYESHLKLPKIQPLFMVPTEFWHYMKRKRNMILILKGSDSVML
jgi:hypothetical protein